MEAARSTHLQRLSRLCCLAALVGAAGCEGSREEGRPSRQIAKPALSLQTGTPIKHLVVIFGENISFDHYFGTYPNAANEPGEPAFSAAPDTPIANNLSTPLDTTNGFVPVIGVDALNANPNFTSLRNGDDAANPIRLGPSHAATQDMGHLYTQEQQAANGGAMDLFPFYVGNGGPPPESLKDFGKGLVMAYYDGNTVSALWLYAQHFALNDNSWSTTLGPSTPGAINLISGQTNGVGQANVDLGLSSNVTADGNGGYTLLGDPDPLGDVCSAAEQVSFKGRNIGDLLNAKGVSWGWFQGGFDLGVKNENTSTGCARSKARSCGSSKTTGSAVNESRSAVRSTPSPARSRTCSNVRTRRVSFRAVSSH